MSRKLFTELVINTPNECIDLIKNCCQNINVIEVLHSDIYLFCDISIKNKPFILQNIKQFEERKGFLNFFVKFSHLETSA
jgi:nitrate reductase NapAB chaperone NapD